MRTHYTKADAAQIILDRIAANEVTGGMYYRAEPVTHRDGKVGNRCAIGWLLTEEEVKEVEGDDVKPAWAVGYPMATEIIDAGRLVVDDKAWFVEAQQIADSSFSYSDMQRLAEHCRAALPSIGYDIGNRRSDPVYR